MSIATYAELQTAIGDWLHRTDLTARIPDFIKIAESRINRELRLFSMENAATLATNTTDRFATLPTGFIEAIDLTLYTENYPQTLTQAPLVRINGRGTTVKTIPRQYSISTNIIFDVISDQVYSCSLRYYKKLDLATDLSNSVLTTYPDIYLYGALLASASYVNNDARLGTWGQLFQDSIRSANRLDARTRGKAKLMTDIGASGQRGDIFTGETD